MKENHTTWKISSWSVAGLLALPIIAIFYMSIGPSDIFPHLMSTVLPIYIANTIKLVAGVMLLSILLGVPSAWLMAMCKLPTEKILQWALVLPLAMPSYIVAYVYTDWFDFPGPIQMLLRDLTGWGPGEYWFPDIRTLTGAVIILALVLYPYVYLLGRAAFMEQNVSLLQSARLLKCSPITSFFRISMPLARPSIAVGLSLVAMETIGDFGTVNYFAVHTLTTAVYDTWLDHSELPAAAKISSIMLMVVILLISAERYSRRRQKLFQTHFNSHEDVRYELQGWKKWAALVWCWGLVSAAFILPLLQLCSYAYTYFAQSWTDEFRQYSLNSLQVSLTAAVFGVAVALIVNFCQRVNPGRNSVMSMRFSSMGYAVPGTVLAIGVMTFVNTVEHGINDFAKWMELTPPGLLLSGSMFALIFAMVVRFSAVAIGSVESSMNKISPSLDMATRTMGCNANEMLRKIHLPLVRRGALIAGLLVFIECMKELNASLLLRPFNFETLATYVFNYASDEQLELAAMPAVLLVLVGLIPLIMVNRSLEQNH